MNKSEYSVGSILLGSFLCVLVVYMCLTFKPASQKINNFYQVYLGGNKIGLIRSKDELYDLIDEEQQEIKKYYKVNKVFPPSGLEVQSVMTYKDNVMTAKEVYNEIKDLDPFTIEGYEVTVTDSNNKKKKFYILNKEDLDTAVRNTITSFLSEEDYEQYLTGNKKSTKDDSIEITDVYFDQNVSIKKTYVSTESQIITNAEDLSRYFLFSDLNPSKKYKVKSNDTIETIAYKNQLGVSDFLLANPSIKSENTLLAVGQEVTVAPIKPVANIAVDSYQTEMQTIKYESKTVLDKTLNASERFVKQKGSNGLSKVVYATHEVNGQIVKTTLVNEDVITPAVDEIIVVGAKNVVYVGTSTYWAWPTTKPYRISSGYGWRVHPIDGTQKFHHGIDIVGTPNNDIYSMQDGEVISSGYTKTMGNYLRIKYVNGYSSTYMHLSQRLVDIGDKVEKGEKVGIMGCTGSCTGKHLHFAVYDEDGDELNPLSVYNGR